MRESHPWFFGDQRAAPSRVRSCRLALPAGLTVLARVRGGALPGMPYGRVLDMGLEGVGIRLNERPARTAGPGERVELSLRLPFARGWTVLPARVTYSDGPVLGLALEEPAGCWEGLRAYRCRFLRFYFFCLSVRAGSDPAVERELARAREESLCRAQSEGPAVRKAGAADTRSHAQIRPRVA